MQADQVHPRPQTLDPALAEMYWTQLNTAICTGWPSTENRDPSTLLTRFIAPPAAPRLIEAIESLLRRSLIDITHARGLSLTQRAVLQELGAIETALRSSRDG